MENNEPSPKTLPVEKAPQATNGDANLPTSDIPQTELPPTDNGTTNETRKESDTPAEFRPLFGRLQSSDGIAARRPSVQFVPQVKVDGSDRSRSRRPTREAGVRRLSSPPPPKWVMLGLTLRTICTDMITASSSLACLLTHLTTVTPLTSL